jgi:hypothetical protein
VHHVSTKWDHHVHAKHTEKFLVQTRSWPCPEPPSQAVRLCTVRSSSLHLLPFKHARSARRERGQFVFTLRQQERTPLRLRVRIQINHIGTLVQSSAQKEKKTAESVETIAMHATPTPANVPTDTVDGDRRVYWCL